MIKFHCSECQKAIGVEEQYAGRLIRCPGCQQPTSVPAPSAEKIETAHVVADSADAPVANKAVFPHCPSCQSALSSSSDVVCGICGYLLDQQPVPYTPSVAKRSPIASQTARGDAFVAPAATTEADMLVNPAIDAKGYAFESPDEYFAYAPEIADRKPTRGSSIGGWVVAVLVGLFVATIWGMIASFTGVIGQAFAIAVGAIVGLIAGLIARNRSLKFCLASSAAALLCMLFGRVVSAWVIMMAVSSMGVFQDLGTYLIPDTAVTIGVAEDMSKDGKFQGDEKTLADMKVEAFFSNQTVEQMDGYDDIDFEVELDVDRKIRAEVGKMTEEEQKAVLQRVRKDYPDWMEESWHLEAIVDAMVKQDEIEDEELLAHAKSKLANLDGSYDGTYYQETSQSERDRREVELEELATKRYSEMTPEQRELAIKEARAGHPAWTPRRDEYLAMLSKMYDADEIPAAHRELAKSTISLELDYDFDDTNLNEFEVEELGEVDPEIALQTIVNKELLKLERDEIDALIVATQEKHPYWIPENDLGAVFGFSGGLDGIIASFESDGTFLSSLKTRFRPLDYLWLALGAISAFVITKLLGREGESEETVASLTGA